MKQIIFLRHAHTVPATATIDDIDRAVTDEGKQEMQYTADKIKKHDFVPDHITTSPSARTMTSANIVAQVLNYPKESIEIQPFLYAAPPTDILLFIEALPHECSNVIIIGHNPGISECASLLSKQPLEHLKTSTGYWICWDKHSSWKKIANGEETPSKITEI